MKRVEIETKLIIIIAPSSVPTESDLRLISPLRHGSIQTRGQLEVIEKFYQYLCSIWKLYPLTVGLTDYLTKQSKLFHGEAEKKYQHVPKVNI